MSDHVCVEPDPDDEGWYWAACACGYKDGPLPDVETMIDDLMEHAASVARRGR